MVTLCLKVKCTTTQATYARKNKNFNGTLNSQQFSQYIFPLQLDSIKKRLSEEANTILFHNI